MLQKVATAATVIAVFLTLACGNRKGPTTPTNTTGPQSISISGGTSLNEPGDTSQLTVLATFADGTTKDATATVTWSAQPSNVASIAPGGLLTAMQYGAATVTAQYGASPPVYGFAKVRVLPAGTFIVTGSVREGGFAVDDAQVEASSPARTVTTATGFDGSYRLLPVAADATIRAVKDGYAAQIKRPASEGDQRLDFELQRTTPATGVEGVYQLTITASSSCTTLPAEVMKRTYPAKIVERQGKVFVSLNGENFEVWGEPGFTGNRSGDVVTFVLSDDILNADYYIMERVGADAYLMYSGTARGEITDRRIAATLDGRVYVRHTRPSDGVIGDCRAADHRLEFVR